MPTKAYWELEGKLHNCIPRSRLRWVVSVTFRSVYPNERAARTHWISDWVGPHSWPDCGDPCHSARCLLLYRLSYIPALTWHILLPPWSWVFEKLIVTQLVTKFLAFYGTRKFVTVFTRARHLTDIDMEKFCLCVSDSERNSEGFQPDFRPRLHADRTSATGKVSTHARTHARTRARAHKRSTYNVQSLKLLPD